MGSIFLLRERKPEVTLKEGKMSFIEKTETALSWLIMIAVGSFVLLFIVGIAYFIFKFWLYVIIAFGIGSVLFVLYGLIEFKHEERKRNERQH